MFGPLESEVYHPFIVVKDGMKWRIDEICDDGVTRDLNLKFWRYITALKIAQALYWARKNAQPK